MDKLKTLRFKEVNGYILKILQDRGFEYVEARIIEALFKEHQTKSELRNVQDHFWYLAGKGKEYVEVDEIDGISKDEEQMRARLTPRGVDLLFGVIDDDPGISLR